MSKMPANLPTPPGTADQFLYYGTGHVGGLRVASGLEHDHVRQPGYPIHARRLNTYASRLGCQQQPLMPLSAR
jgi:hypothetical protein